VTEVIVAPINIFCPGPGRVSNATGSSKIGSTHESRDTVELNLTPSAGTVGHLYFGAGRHMGDHTKRRAGSSAQNRLVCCRYCGCVRKPGCDDKETGAEQGTRVHRHFFLSLTVIFPSLIVIRTDAFFAPTRAATQSLRYIPAGHSIGPTAMGSIGL
jgi:hypothetical protein